MSSAVLIAYHSLNQALAHQIGDHLTSNQCEIYLISETVPEKVSERAKLVQVSGVVLVVADRNFQKSITCLEIVHFARDSKKKIFGININPKSFVPFGPLGAIISATQHGFIHLNHESNLSEALGSVIECAKKLESQGASKRGHPSDFRSPTPAVPVTFVNEPAKQVLISTHSDSTEIAQIVERGLQKNGIECHIEDCGSDSSSVVACKTLVVIMSPGYEDDVRARLIVEKARSISLPIVPVSKTREWKPVKWLGMVIAGVIFYRITDEVKAYEKKHDSCPMDDLAFEVKKALTPKPSNDDIEISLIQSLDKQIEECREKLGSDWPPPIVNRERLERKPVIVKLEAPKAEIEFAHIHHQVWRMELKPPPPVFDQFGRPLRKKFDCMISYNWGVQNLVLDIYMDLNMRNLAAWFDIWGFMEENSCNSMATAIECSRVIVVFISEKYQKSDNCILEFKYAVFCGKAFIFILTDPGLKLEPWLEPHVKLHPCFTVQNYKDVTVMHNNVALIDSIAQAIRAIGQAQPDYDVFDLSEEVVHRKELLLNAKDALDKKAGSTRFKTCDRCKKSFEDSNATGCKIHSAYYVGGSIIEGRWVCCHQQAKDSVGCRDALHSEVKRTWTRDNHYGTYTWEPH